MVAPVWSLLSMQMIEMVSLKVAEFLGL
ncbi:hypothetical protein Goari_004543, partial [Gossypium aridum]|nr:hypothetical protein [Gossypium aridum]